MRKLLAGAAALAAALVTAVPALAHDGEDGERVCRGFKAAGTVTAVGSRAFGLALAEGKHAGQAGKTLELRTGSRTHVDGTLAVGATVKARGTVCQLDDADEAVFYASDVKVKKPKAERALGSFKLAGEVVAVGDDTVDVTVEESTVDAFVGKTVRLRLGHETEVEGDLVAGARVVAAGKAKIVGGEAVLLAFFVAATGGEEADESHDDSSDM